MQKKQEEQLKKRKRSNMETKLFRILGVEVRTQLDSIGDLHYSVRLGNTTKGFFYLTKTLQTITIMELRNLLKELTDKQEEE